MIHFFREGFANYNDLSLSIKLIAVKCIIRITSPIFQQKSPKLDRCKRQTTLKTTGLQFNLCKKINMLGLNLVTWNLCLGLPNKRDIVTSYLSINSVSVFRKLKFLRIIQRMNLTLLTLTWSWNKIMKKASWNIHKERHKIC